jgi:NAD(P)-dependent dehydrogenase (short-subunit alcohol dehydrogenase family)
MNRLLNKAALITGGSTGIGRAVALAFAGEGANVAVASRGHQSEAESLAREIEALGRRCLPLRADVTCEADVRAMVEAVREQFGRIDVFVNNAGMQRPQAITEMTLSDW